MPTYVYRREDGTQFEFFQKMSDAALTVCPETGQSVQRVITGGTGVLYKGEGWYITDYKRAGSKQPAASEGTAAAAPKTETPAPAPAAG